jgi:tetratricopeptide (TPR) repeat protein
VSSTHNSDVAGEAGTLDSLGIGDRFQQAGTQAGLGRAHLALGDLDQAREQYRRALDRYTDLEMPQADEIRAHLTLNG